MLSAISNTVSTLNISTHTFKITDTGLVVFSRDFKTRFDFHHIFWVETPVALDRLSGFVVLAVV
jgi:hypothetical protein